MFWSCLLPLNRKMSTITNPGNEWLNTPWSRRVSINIPRLRRLVSYGKQIPTKISSITILLDLCKFFSASLLSPCGYESLWILRCTFSHAVGKVCINVKMEGNDFRLVAVEGPWEERLGPWLLPRKAWIPMAFLPLDARAPEHSLLLCVLCIGILFWANSLTCKLCLVAFAHVCTYMHYCTLLLPVLRHYRTSSPSSTMQLKTVSFILALLVTKT